MVRTKPGVLVRAYHDSAAFEPDVHAPLCSEDAKQTRAKIALGSLQKISAVALKGASLPCWLTWSLCCCERVFVGLLIE
jgi:hypothetical protein